MGERPDVVIPTPGPRDRDFVREFMPWWQQAEEKWWGKFVPESVRHIHDPEWRNRTWSIQAAHDRKGVWKPVSWLFYTAMYAFSIGGVVVSILEIGPIGVVATVGIYILMFFLRKAVEDI